MAPGRGPALADPGGLRLVPAWRAPWGFVLVCALLVGAVTPPRGCGRSRCSRWRSGCWSASERRRARSGRAERARRTADELRSLALGSTDGDLDRALSEVAREDASDVLGAILRDVAPLTAVQQLRHVELGEAADDLDRPAGADAAAVSDDELPPDPWQSSGDEASNALEHAGALFEALAEQRTVPDLFRAIGALDESEAFTIVLERALSAMAERRLPSRQASEASE
jgi:hypothetical protein